MTKVKYMLNARSRCAHKAADQTDSQLSQRKLENQNLRTDLQSRTQTLVCSYCRRSKKLEGSGYEIDGLEKRRKFPVYTDDLRSVRSACVDFRWVAKR